VKYKGKKLDAYKNTWFKKRKQDQNKETEVSDGKFLLYFLHFLIVKNHRILHFVMFRMVKMWYF
jgi:hypothetical protein